MTSLAPDEKVCPFCAETIKKAAVKCRWCQSDLTGVPAQAGPAAEPAPAAEEPGTEPAPTEEEPETARAATAAVPWTRWAVTGVLALALVVAGTVLVRQLLAQDDWAGVPEGTTPLAAGAEVSSEEARRAALVAATAATEQILSYDAKTLEEDIAAAQEVLAGDMVEEYATTMDALREKTEETKAKVEATVVATSVISASEHDAKLLLFVNQLTTLKEAEQPRVDLNRVVVTLHRDEGDWLVTGMDAF